MDKTTIYNITDYEGDSFKIEYISRSCRCHPVGCIPDTLIIYDYPELGGEEEGNMEESGPLKGFMLNLLEGDYKVEKVNE